jgi:hypothetical protein
MKLLATIPDPASARRFLAGVGELPQNALARDRTIGARGTGTRPSRFFVSKRTGDPLRRLHEVWGSARRARGANSTGRARVRYALRVSAGRDDVPDWERLLSAERHVQALVPGAVLVGRTAAALHAGHRRNLDGDHVLADLRDHFDDVLAALKSVAGWETARTRRPVLILGRLEGVMTGIRQLRRTRPLETETIEGVVVPTLAERAPIKAWLLVTRYTVRDYLDTVVLLEKLGAAGARDALRSLDEIYRQPNGASPLVEVAERLAEGAPADRVGTDLGTYKQLVAPWNDWEHVFSRGRAWSTAIAGWAMAPDGAPA